MQFLSGCKQLYRLTTPAIVFGTLGLIAWGGHTFHWDLAHASEAILHPGEKDKSVSATLEPAPASELRAVLHITDDMPSFAFTSKESALNCGIQIDTVVERTLDEQLATNAEVAYDQTHLAQLASRVSGTVVHVERRLGDEVKRGELLALVDSTEVGDAKLSLMQACITLHLKGQHRDRLLNSQDVIPGKERIEADANYRLAKTARFNALQKLVNMGFQIELKDVEGLNEKQLEERLQLLGIPEEQNVESKSFNLIPLVAPFDGTIIRCEVVRGEAVHPLEAIYELADTSRMWVLLNARQDDAAKLHIGMPITFESGASSQSVQGNICWISSQLDPKTRMIQARAEVQNPTVQPSDSSSDKTRALRAGIFGTANISLVQQSGVAIPNSAMHWIWEIGQEVVFVANEDECNFTPVVVKKGVTHDGYVEIEDGLKAGKKIVSNGSRILAAELSDHLQEHLGDNAAAVRDFHHSDNIYDDLATNQAE
jgi:multidrug resistance efflux pump